MASKRSRRRQRVELLGYDPKDDQNFERAWKARQWDFANIRRFEEAQRRKREWINFVEIAEWYSELKVPTTPKKAAAAREQAYSMLERDLLAGLFEEGGRSRVLFLHPGLSVSHWKMERQWLRDAIDNNYDSEHGRSYLRHCWLPRTFFKRWCAWHHLPTSPPRFEPQESRGCVSPEGAVRSSEAPMPVQITAPQTASKLVVDTVSLRCRAALSPEKYASRKMGKSRAVFSLTRIRLSHPTRVRILIPSLRSVPTKADDHQQRIGKH